MGFIYIGKVAEVAFALCGIIVTVGSLIGITLDMYILGSSDQKNSSHFSDILLFFPPPMLLLFIAFIHPSLVIANQPQE